MPDQMGEPNLALILLLVAFAAPLCTALIGARRPAWTGNVATVLTAVVLAVVVYAYSVGDVMLDVPWASDIGLRFHLQLDGVARMFALLAAGVGLLVVMYASRYIPLHLAHQERSLTEQPRFFAFLLLFMAAMIGLVMAGDVILQFIFWDLTAIASFYLIGYDREQEDSRSSAMMALLVTGISAVLVLIGVLLLHQEFGTFDLTVLVTEGATSTMSQWALGLIVVGALAKSAQVPLHFWLPKAMAAPTPVSAYLHSAAMVAAGVFLVRRFYPLVQQIDWLMDAMLVVGFASIAVGGIISLTRDNLKQILAYSTISQYGYVVVMFGLGNAYGLSGAMFYIFAHALVKSALFMSAGAVTEATGSKYMSKAGGLWRDMPWLAVGSGLAAAGLVALPLTIGFFKDELFFASAWERGAGFGVLAVMSAGFTFAYVGRFWKGIFLGQRQTAPKAVPAMLVVPIVILGMLTVLFGVWTPWVVDIAEQAATIDLAHPAHIHIAYHLDLRAENAMAVMAWVLGLSIILTERWWREAALTVSRLGEIFGPERIYWSSLRNLELLSDWVHRIEVRDLRSRVATILAPTGLLVGIAAILTPNSDAFVVGLFEQGDLPLATMLVATMLAAIAVAIPRGHLRIVLTLSCVGFSLAVIYALLGAPDVALVAVLVETVLGILFVAMLLLMPRSILRFETREPAERSGVRRDVILAALSAAMAFIVVWGILSRPSGSNQLINTYDRLTPEAHGTDVVTVILADFRGFDTLGEITVVALVALGVLGLIRKGRLR